jgi:hypothetical protein
MPALPTPSPASSSKPSGSSTAIRLPANRVLPRRIGYLLTLTNLPRPAERAVAFYNQRNTTEQWIKNVGAKIVSHGRYVAQMAEVAIPRKLFEEILRMIAELRPPPDPAQA